MNKTLAEFISAWWKVAVIIVVLLGVVVRVSADVVEMLNAPEQIKALQVQDSVTGVLIDDMARNQEQSLLRNERRLDQFGFVLCDVLDRPAVDCTIGGIPNN